MTLTNYDVHDNWPPEYIVTLTYFGQPDGTSGYVYRSRNVLCARLLMPDVESVSPNGTTRIGQQVSAGMEVAMDECVSGEKGLGLAG